MTVKKIEIQQVQELLDYIEEKTAVTPEEAFEIIYYLQEKMHIIPDKFEICRSCNVVYDSDFEGSWNEEKGGFCGFCNS